MCEGGPDDEQAFLLARQALGAPSALPPVQQQAGRDADDDWDPYAPLDAHDASARVNKPYKKLIPKAPTCALPLVRIDGVRAHQGWASRTADACHLCLWPPSPCMPARCIAVRTYRSQRKQSHPVIAAEQ